MYNKYFLLFLGDKSNEHLKAICSYMNDNYNSIDGFKFINFTNNSSFYEEVESELDNLKNKNIEPIIMKGFNIHTEDYIKAIIKYYKRDNKDKKFLLTHCAVFSSFILSDAAILTNYNKENIYNLIINALTLAKKLKGKINNSSINKVALLNAGGSSNLNTATEEWKNIYNTLQSYNKLYKNKFDLELEQFDVCIDKNIREKKLYIDKKITKFSDIELPIIIVPSNINEGNSIWKSLTVVGKQTLAGIVVGIPMYIGLTSRTDKFETIKKTIEYLIYLAENEKVNLK